MPELIDTPVTMADFPEVIPAARSLFLAVIGAGGIEGLVRIEDALQLLEVGDFPDISSLIADAIAAKADKATPFVDVASAATINLGAAASTSVNITGTTAITSFGNSAPDGTEYLLKFDGSLIVTDGGNLVTGTGANIITFAGMLMRVVKDAANVWRVIEFTRRINVSGGGANRQVANLAAYTADRTVTWPDGPVTVPEGTLATQADLAALVYTGSNVSNAVYPVGTTISVTGASPNRNASVAVYLSDTTSDFTATVTASPVAGTWRGRGRPSTGNIIAQRTA